MTHVLFYSIFICLLGACGLSSIEESTKSGVITTGGITADVIDSTGAPVIGAKVTYQSKNRGHNPLAAKGALNTSLALTTVDTIYTDTNGIFSIKDLESNTYIIRIQNENINGTVYEVAYSEGGSIDTVLTLTQLTTLSIGFAPQLASTPVYVTLLNLGDTFTVSGDSILTIPYLPEYSYDIYFKNTTTGEETTQYGITTRPGLNVKLEDVTIGLVVSIIDDETMSSGVQMSSVLSSSSIASISSVVLQSSTVESSSSFESSSSTIGQYALLTSTEIGVLRAGGVSISDLLAGDADVRALFDSELMLKALRDNGVSEDSLKAELIIGTLIDSRDSQEYPWFTLGGYVWMGKNLNYDVGAGSYCYDDAQANCDVSGRMYTWHVAMAGAASSDLHPSGVQGICPMGWHVPSEWEWNQLLNDVRDISGVYDMDAVSLMYKATSGWGTDEEGKTRDGTDLFGFAAVPGGAWSEATGSVAAEHAFWWTSKEGVNDDAVQRFILNDTYAGDLNRKNSAQMIRCLQDY